MQPARKAWLADIVRSTHRRTLELVAGLDADQLLGPCLPVVNPPLWEIGHVAYFHEHFILKRLDGRCAIGRDFAGLYDSMRVAHDRRWDLPLPSLDDTLQYRHTVERALLCRLGEDDGEASAADSYFYRLTTLHEDMHAEALTYTRQTLGYPAPGFALEGVTPAPHGEGPWPGDVTVPACRHWLGADRSVPFSFDNERAAHEVAVDAFRIARAPVTNAEFAEFVAADGYARPELWSEAGWRWRERNAVEAPAYWLQDGAGHWHVRRFDGMIDLPAHQPVTHVCFHEAQAYCHWAGRRLPSEAEWEVAASRLPAADDASLLPAKRRFPWGNEPATPVRANVDGSLLGPVDVAAYPQGDSALGCRQMIGNVWEWTATVFGPFPGFRPDPYKAYSTPWFQERRRVLRGGAWSTRGRVVNNHYRNFFPPERRDLYAGFRTCAPSGGGGSG